RRSFWTVTHICSGEVARRRCPRQSAIHIDPFEVPSAQSVPIPYRFTDATGCLSLLNSIMPDLPNRNFPCCGYQFVILTYSEEIRFCRPVWSNKCDANGALSP